MLYRPRFGCLPAVQAALLMTACVGVVEPGADDPPVNGAAPGVVAPSRLPGVVTIPGAIPSQMQPSAGAGGTPGSGIGPLPSIPAGLVALPGGARALSPREYDATIRDLFGGLELDNGNQLPEPAASRELPFENDAPSKLPSNVLIESLEDLAWDVASQVIKTPASLARVLPCMPKGPADTACLEMFVTRFGRRVLRRPIERAEIESYLSLKTFAVEKGDALEAVRLIIATLLQQPDFYHRIEQGRPVVDQKGVFRLTGYEVATKLSYLLIGTTPDERLLDLAAAGKLDDAESIAAAAQALLADPRARAQVVAFHAQWLGFANLQHDPLLVKAMNAESRALIEDVVFTRKASHHELFLSPRTFIDDRLARLYDLPLPGKTDWVPVGGGTGRIGLLSQGTFLSAAAKPDDTSPVNRGLLVANRLLCRHIPEPPPDLDTTLPETTSCRLEMLQKHFVRGSSCSACHANIDPIGFGLENYDRTGKYRTTEKGRPACAIDGAGDIPGLGKFRGPAELAKLLVTSPDLDRCLVSHVQQFAVGRTATPEEAVVIDRLTGTFTKGGRRFVDLLLALVTDSSFVHRRAPN